MQQIRIFAVTATVVALVATLSACGNSSFSKAREVINVGLAKDPSCINVEVGVPAGPPDELHRAIYAQLKSKGFVVDGKVPKYVVFGENQQVPGLVFTETGNSLVTISAKPGLIPVYPCIRIGKFEVTNVEAIDVANDNEGNVIASVRSKIKFVPETWLSDMKDSPVASAYLQRMTDLGKKQWLYKLRKSGDEYFYVRKGVALN